MAVTAWRVLIIGIDFSAEEFYSLDDVDTPDYQSLISEILDRNTKKSNIWFRLLHIIRQD